MPNAQSEFLIFNLSYPLIHYCMKSRFYLNFREVQDGFTLMPPCNLVFLEFASTSPDCLKHQMVM